MTPPSGSDNWASLGAHVLAELTRLSNSIDELNTRVGQLSSDVSALKVKASIWGALSGAGIVAIALGIWMIKTA